MTMGGPMPPGKPLPKSPFGGPAGPGATPAMSPGGGAGNEAAAIADIKSTIPILMKSANVFPVGDKRRQALLRSVMALEANFGKSDTDDLTAAAAQRIGAAAKPGSGLQGHNMPPPGIALGGPSPMPGMGGGQGGGMGGPMGAPAGGM
jgi:hypothetical protein